MPGKTAGRWRHGVGGIARAQTFNRRMKEADNHLIKDVNNKATNGPNLITNLFSSRNIP
jgi:hypothetical protein